MNWRCAERYTCGLEGARPLERYNWHCWSKLQAAGPRPKEVLALLWEMHKELADGTTEIQNEEWCQLWHLIFQKRPSSRCKGVPGCQQGEVTYQHLQVWISWCTGPQHLDHCSIVRREFHPLCRPLVTPQRSCQNNQKEFFVANANQGAPYPTELAVSEETWRSGMGAQRGDWKNSSHHDKSKLKLSIKPYRMVLSAKRWEQCDP